ncbi:MAG: TIGR03016 family PEP-CTERM system-associated outer membrane protein [Pseudomonadota bacterium]
MNSESTSAGWSTVLRSNSVAAVCLALGVFDVHAGEWEFTPRINFSEEYSDNVTLNDQNTLSDFISTITPGVTIRGVSSRLQTNVDYNMQNLRYIDNDNFNRTNHQLQSKAVLTLIDQVFDFEATAALSQQQVNNRGNFVTSARSQTGNRADVLNYQFRPILKHHFGNWADATGSFTRSFNENSGGNVGGVGSGSTDRTQISLRTGSRFARTPTRFNFRRNKSEFDSGRVNETQSFTANFSYIVDRKLRLTAETGIDDNSFGGGSGNNNRDGFRWRLGGTWTPSQRTSVSGHFGERGFGSTFDVAVSHRHRRLNFNLNYSEQLRTNAQRQAELVLVPLTDANDLPSFDPFVNSNILTPLNTASINEEVSLSKRLNVGLNYQLRRSTVGATYYQTERTFQSSLNGEETRGYSFFLNRSFSPRLSGALSFSWRQSLRQTGQNDNELFQFSPSLTYVLGPRSSLNLSYSYVDSKGGTNNQFSNDFLENALTANLAVFY